MCRRDFRVTNIFQVRTDTRVVHFNYFAWICQYLWLAIDFFYNKYDKFQTESYQNVSNNNTVPMMLMDLCLKTVNTALV